MQRKTPTPNRQQLFRFPNRINPIQSPIHKIPPTCSKKQEFLSARPTRSEINSINVETVIRATKGGPDRGPNEETYKRGAAEED